MHHWLFLVAGCALLLTASLQLYSAFRGGDGADLSEAARLRRRANVASACGAAIYGVALLYFDRSDSTASYVAFSAGAVAFAILVIVGNVLSRRARKMEGLSASAADRV